MRLNTSSAKGRNVVGIWVRQSILSISHGFSEPHAASSNEAMKGIL